MDGREGTGLTEPLAQGRQRCYGRELKKTDCPLQKVDKFVHGQPRIADDLAQRTF